MNYYHVKTIIYLHNKPIIENYTKQQIQTINNSNNT